MVYKKQKNKVFSFIYCISMILFLMISVSVITSSDGYKVETWQDYASFEFEQEVAVDDNGEQVVTNLISTPEQLAGFFAMQSEENVHADSHSTYFTSTNSYKLKNNIDLSGKTWSPSSNSRTLDGMSFTIKNLNVSSSSSNVGFLSSNSGTIKNLVFENCKITSSSSSAVIGTVAGKNTGTIESVTIVGGTVKATASGTRKAGGIVGENSGTIKECSNSATVSQGAYVGGIAGQMSGGTITNCYNYGSISAGSNSTTRMGGIVGYLSSGTLKLSMNSGKITDTSSTVSTEMSVGGVVGYTAKAIDQCGNSGKISVGGSKVEVCYVGGVVGYASNCGVSNCYNTAEIAASAKSKSKTLNVSYNSSTKKWTNTECYETDAAEDNFKYIKDKEAYTGVYNQWRENWYYFIKSTKGNTDRTVGRYVSYSDAFAGGVIGVMSSDSYSISKCYNTGSVSKLPVTYKDTYVYNLYYQQKFHTAGIHGYTQYTEISAKTYYDTIQYTYEFRGNPILGNCSKGKSATDISSKIGTESYQGVKAGKLSTTLGIDSYNKTNSYSYWAYSYYYHSTSFLPITALLAGAAGLLGLGLNIAGFFVGSNKKESKSTSGTASASKDVKISSSDDALFSVAHVSNVRQYFYVDSSSNKVYVKAKFKSGSTEKTKAITKSDYVSINQVSPGSVYSTKTASQFKATSSNTVVNTLGSSVWGINSEINGGYPYILAMYW